MKLVKLTTELCLLDMHVVVGARFVWVRARSFYLHRGARNDFCYARRR